MSNTPPILETERLVLLPWKLEYAEDMLLFAANETVAKEREVKLIPDIKSAKAKIRSIINRNKDEWAIALKTENGNKIVGSVGIYKHAKSWKDFNQYNLSFNLVYLIAEEYWGMGICTEAAQKVMHYAFVGIKCDALGAIHRNWNHRSQKVIEKCKFTKINKKYDLDDPNTWIHYCLTRNDYFNCYHISEGSTEYGFVDSSKYAPKPRTRKPSQKPKYDPRQPRQVKGSPYSTEHPIRKINNITYIKQPTDYLCGQTCVAMLAGVSVDEVIKVIGTEKSTNQFDIRKALNYYGIRYAPIQYKYAPHPPLPDLCLVVFTLPQYRHWSLYFNGTFYDPEFGLLNAPPADAVLSNLWKIYS